MTEAIQRYRCCACGHICTTEEMGADYIWHTEDGDEEWSNWICPKCGIWGEEASPENTDDDSWIPVKDNA